MSRAFGIALFTSAVLLAGSPGIRPRAAVADYPAHAGINAAAFGAAVIPAAAVKKIFAADVDKAGYVVVEVGVFPAGGRELDLSPLDFTLRTDPNAISERTADADAIAAAVAKPARGVSPESPAVEVSVTAGLGADVSYPDPVTGRTSRRRPVPIAVAWNKSLPDGKTTLPVAGYLYFPKPSKKTKGAAWVLEWQNTGERVNITLPK